MAVFDIFSERRARATGSLPDIYKYDEIPDNVRVQIVHILREFLGNDVDYYGTARVADAYNWLHDGLAREYGVFSLVGKRGTEISKQQALFEFILSESECDKVLDGIEVSFRVIEKLQSTPRGMRRGLHVAHATEAIEELNVRLRESGVGYRYESGELVRIDTEFTHTEIVKPAISLLRDKKYSGAEEEFQNALEHHRHGRHKEALVDAPKAFESVLKVTCIENNWATPSKPSCKQLLDVVFERELLPKSQISQFGGIRSVLESGLPTLRNELGGHGQGKEPISVPAFFASYAIQLSASAMVFVAEASKASKNRK